MGALVSAWDQWDMFPEATEQEVKQTKKVLVGYRRMKMTLESLAPQYDFLNGKQLAIFKDFEIKVRLIEQAVNIIQDEEIKRIVTFRFIRGKRYKDTVIFFGIMSNRTVDRKIIEGIVSVANTLKLWE
ncbi:hypothetical protein ACFOLF_12320 [Paenibacillus sepulcri]|uniref:Uncharacterized protein n=1 Tax=Paenibacillus sepulcri TaxID=359917 RepID=A0ABS7BUY0_9BACL|nr:hypothetical protein [Paenibacillus sepulcri]